MKTTAIPQTHIVIVNEVLGTRREYDSPQSPEECLANNYDCLLAAKFCDQLRFLDEYNMEPPSLSCALRHDKSNIFVRWYADGSAEDAIDELALILKGETPEGGVA